MNKSFLTLTATLVFACLDPSNEVIERGTPNSSTAGVGGRATGQSDKGGQAQAAGSTGDAGGGDSGATAVTSGGDGGDFVESGGHGGQPATNAGGESGTAGETSGDYGGSGGAAEGGSGGAQPEEYCSESALEFCHIQGAPYYGTYVCSPTLVGGYCDDCPAGDKDCNSDPGDGCELSVTFCPN